jgi:hypothetical protein
VGTIQDFRKEVDIFISNAVYGFAGFDQANALRFRESRIAYTEEIMGPRYSQVAANTGTGGTLFTVFPIPASTTIPKTGLVTGLQSSIQPGEKGYQFRLWLIEEDESLDVNIPSLIVGMEIVVHRCLLFSDEEYFYTNDEMVQNQKRLLDKSAWRDKEFIPSLQELVAGPIIDSVPTRESNVLSYTVAVSASLIPD